ncbi:MAG: hypothetical protein KJ578_01585 [Bacteroidetes bacterium]|nr:hypothetical protein [Bacteroidota bacterium]MBU1578494.1 hypothetical protein [Bacteroidota bacterium]MBU2556454.1 hypothetical protein [Bacteroidota bacterium]
MKKKLFSHALLLLVFSMIFLAFTPKKTIRLKYDFNSGDKFKLEIRTQQNISMNMGGQSMVIKQNITLNQSAEILSVSDEGNTNFEISYDRIRFNQNAMGMEVNWDSDQPDAGKDDIMVQQISAQMQQAIDKKVNATIDEFGNPIANNNSEVMGSTNVSGFEMGMLIVFPDYEVGQGDSWEVSTQPDPNSDFVINSVYTLDEIKGKVAIISYEGTITGSEMNGTEAKLSGNISGKAEISTKTGWLEKATTMQTLEMEMQQQGQTIPMTMSSVIELESN